MATCPRCGTPIHGKAGCVHCYFTGGVTNTDAAEADLAALQPLLDATEGWDDIPDEADDFIHQRGAWKK